MELYLVKVLIEVSLLTSRSLKSEVILKWISGLCSQPVIPSIIFQIPFYALTHWVPQELNRFLFRSFFPFVKGKVLFRSGLFLFFWLQLNVNLFYLNNMYTFTIFNIRLGRLNYCSQFYTSVAGKNSAIWTNLQISSTAQ